MTARRCGRCWRSPSRGRTTAPCSPRAREDALGKLRAEKPALALVDANLGAQSGYDLCQQIKREAPQVGVIILASKQQPFDKARGATVGSDDFIDKPFDTQQLIDKVAAVLRRVGEAARAPAAAQPVAAAAAPLQPMASAGLGQPAGGARRSAPLQHSVLRLFDGPARQRAAGRRRFDLARSDLHRREPATRCVFTGRQTGFGSVAAGRRRPRRSVTRRWRELRCKSKRLRQPPPVAVAAAPAAALAGDGAFADKLSGLGLTREQVQGVLSLSREVVEQVVWEVVPVLAETLIKEEIKRLTSE